MISATATDDMMARSSRTTFPETIFCTFEKKRGQSLLTYAKVSYMNLDFWIPFSHFVYPSTSIEKAVHPAQTQTRIQSGL
jgi:hypothetical protein